MRIAEHLWITLEPFSLDNVTVPAGLRVGVLLLRCQVSPPLAPSASPRHGHRVSASAVHGRRAHAAQRGTGSAGLLGRGRRLLGGREPPGSERYIGSTEKDTPDTALEIDSSLSSICSRCSEIMESRMNRPSALLLSVRAMSSSASAMRSSGFWLMLRGLL